MKNIYVLPTDKPSRLYLFEERLILGDLVAVAFKDSGAVNQNIYIVSQEEIKRNEYYLCKLSMKIKKCIGDEYFNNIDEKKIILTTDQDLIKDGIQAIDDVFLEWFVKNPSCEFVKVKAITYPSTKGFLKGKTLIIKNIYEIIIPKEYWLLNNPQCKQIESCSKSLSKKCICPKEEPKQETLEEFAECWFGKDEFYPDPKQGFIAGAKWQQEQDKKMYSEEDVLDFLVGILDANKCFVTFKDIKEWFEQFKNK